MHTYKYPAEEPRCVLITLHGVNSYSQPTGYIAKILAESGCEVIAFDFRGHGKSQGLRGYIPSVDLLIEDTQDFIQEISLLYPSLPLFLMGGSLGGAVVLNVSIILGDKIKGIVLINPALGINSRFEGIARGISTCLASCCPTFPILKPDLTRSSGHENLHKYIEENPFYYHGKIRIGTSAALLNGMKELRKKYHLVKSPLLLIQGSGDKITSIEKVNKFMQEVNVTDKMLLTFPCRPHSIIFEDIVIDIAQKIKKWVNDRI